VTLLPPTQAHNSVTAWRPGHGSAAALRAGSRDPCTRDLPARSGLARQGDSGWSAAPAGCGLAGHVAGRSACWPDRRPSRDPGPTAAPAGPHRFLPACVLPLSCHPAGCKAGPFLPRCAQSGTPVAARLAALGPSALGDPGTRREGATGSPHQGGAMDRGQIVPIDDSFLTSSQSGGDHGARLGVDQDRGNNQRPISPGRGRRARTRPPGGPALRLPVGPIRRPRRLRLRR
jgi:hypothetical protein